MSTQVVQRLIYPVTRHFSHNLVFYRGPSMLTGEPILGIAGQATSNPKTGPVVQVWVLRSDISPIEAVKSGGDAAICGGCRHRGDGMGNQRSCYVEYFRAPFNLWRGLPNTQRDIDPAALALRLTGKHVRLAAYGDPAALPFETCEGLLTHAAGWTAYTHQWRHCDRRFRRIAMASVDSPGELREARRRGWRTFRVRTRDQALMAGEIQCPASAEAGHLTQCSRCGLCCGTNKSAKSIAIIAHGSNATHFGGEEREPGMRGPANCSNHRMRSPEDAPVR
jgi:hypothetical protein